MLSTIHCTQVLSLIMLVHSSKQNVPFTLNSVSSIGSYCWHCSSIPLSSPWHSSSVTIIVGVVNQYLKCDWKHSYWTMKLIYNSRLGYLRNGVIYNMTYINKCTCYPHIRPPLHRGNNACAFLLPPEIVQGCHEMLNGSNSIVVEVCKWLAGSEEIATEWHEGRGWKQA